MPNDLQENRFIIRDLQTADIPHVYSMLRELAEFEKLSEQLIADPAMLQEALLTEPRRAEGIVAQQAETGELAAYAIFFENFSTFLCRRGIYLEDLYVRPQQRQLGIGTAMLRHLAKTAVERDCGRMEWSVLDWNENAIRFYESLGAEILPDWRTVRLQGGAIESLSDPKQPEPAE